jgi:hypothetical protein
VARRKKKTYKKKPNLYWVLPSRPGHRLTQQVDWFDHFFTFAGLLLYLERFIYRIDQPSCLSLITMNKNICKI